MNNNNKFKLTIFIFLLIGVNIFAQGGSDEISIGNSEFRQLSIEEQFKIYLMSKPVSEGAMGYPKSEMLAMLLTTDNNPDDVFRIAKRYAKTFSFEYRSGNESRYYTTVKDFRFDLILEIFFILSYEVKLSDAQVEWLIEFYEDKMVNYIKTEKRIDDNVAGLTYFLEYSVMGNEIEDLQECVTIAYQKYIIDKGIIPPETVLLEEGFDVPEHVGMIVER